MASDFRVGKQLNSKQIKKRYFQNLTSRAKNNLMKQGKNK